METAVRKFLTVLVALVLGAILTELFLRALIPVEARFETWFTPGIEIWDNEFGAVYRPGWSGTMRHIDGVYRGVSLELEEHGFRQPMRNNLPGKPKRILLMGGRSAMMSYGLADDETIPAQIVKAAGLPMEAQSIAWAGGNMIRSWNLYRRHLLDEDWDLVVISHVNPYLPAFKDHTAFDKVPAPAPKEWVFRYMDGIVLWRDGLFLKTGRAAFASYLGYGLIRMTDLAIKEIDRLGSGTSGNLEEVIRQQAEGPDPQALADYTAFLEHVEDFFNGRGIPVMLHFIPRPYAEKDHHAPYRDPLARSFDVIDLNAELHAELQPGAFMANGHYDRELARKIGQALSREVSARLLTDKP